MENFDYDNITEDTIGPLIEKQRFWVRSLTDDHDKARKLEDWLNDNNLKTFHWRGSDYMLWCMEIDPPIWAFGILR